MNTDASLETQFWLMVLLQTIGSIDMPGSGARKMPAPRNYVAILIAWSVLQLGADAGYDRAANATGWVIVLAGLVLGPFGQKLVNLFTKVANTYGVSSGTPATAQQTAAAQPGVSAASSMASQITNFLRSATP